MNNTKPNFPDQILAHLSTDEIAALAKKEIKRQLMDEARKTRRAGKNPKDQIAHKGQSFIRNPEKAQHFSKIMLEVHGADARNVTVRRERSLASFEDFVMEATPAPSAHTPAKSVPVARSWGS